MKNINIPFGVSITFGFFSIAVYIWILDILGLDVWVAHTIGDFFAKIVERIN